MARADLQLPVDFTMRLDGFDDLPATQPLIYTFVGDEDEVLLTSDRNLQSDAFTGWRPAPWDVTDIVVEQTDDVLGIFDAETAATADAVMDATTAALDVVNGQVPAWSGHVTVYNISDVDCPRQDEPDGPSADRRCGLPRPAHPGRRRSRPTG